LHWATLTVALGPADENGLAQLGLSSRSVEAGEVPHSSSARGSPVDSGRPAVSGQGASPGGKDPDLGHRRRRGSPWWARDGDASRRWGTSDGRPEKRWRVSARGSWSGGELGRRLRSMGGCPHQLKEVAGSGLRRLLAADGGSAAGLAWRRGTRWR
jgi:hypothetical protein